MSVPTGSEVLDRALGGGFPEGRTVLVTGGPGTGKSTLAMQFLQEGLESDEQCLFLSTEQTVDELTDAFESFAFDLDHENLTISSIHARIGQTLEDDEERLTLQTLDGGATLGDHYSAPFEPKYIVEHLREFGPADRVVLDSISGLSAMGEDYDRYRRSVFELIRLFNDEFEATTVFTAEESQPGGSTADTSIAAQDAIQFNTHGVVRLWRENRHGDYHRFMEITKMRGVDHDTRVFEVDFSEKGIHTHPRRRTHPGDFVPEATMSTNIEGLDALLGGGIALGGTMLLQHDGQASPHAIVTNLMKRAVEEDMAVTIAPPVELPPKRLRRIIDDRIGDMDELLEADRLFLVDFPNIWENTRRNVFKPTEHEDEGVADVFRAIDERRGNRDMFSFINVESQLPILSNDALRKVRFWEEENLFLENDTSLYFFNPKTMDEQLAEFYMNAAWQVLYTWIDDNGLQYVRLRKSPSGFLGATRLVEYHDEEPYMHVQRPPRPVDEEGV